MKIARCQLGKTHGCHGCCELLSHSQQDSLNMLLYVEFPPPSRTNERVPSAIPEVNQTSLRREAGDRLEGALQQN